VPEDASVVVGAGGGRADGERRRTTKRGFATVKDANRFRRHALARHEQGLGRSTVLTFAIRRVLRT